MARSERAQPKRVLALARRLRRVGRRREVTPRSLTPVTLSVSSVTIVFTVATAPSASSISTMWVPISRIGCSRRTLRRSMRRSRASRIASTISLAPTEPKSLPSSPARWWIVSTVLESSEAACSSRSARAFLRLLGSGAAARGSPAPGGGRRASLRGIR